MSSGVERSSGGRPPIRAAAWRPIAKLIAAGADFLRRPVVGGLVLLKEVRGPWWRAVIVVASIGFLVLALLLLQALTYKETSVTDLAASTPMRSLRPASVRPGVTR